uniref:Uncharacterized protein n=1 Tax=Rhabditophanes sp. KR3021 TaxID=114890 RepID=A0AC35TWU3_9BILA
MAKIIYFLALLVVVQLVGANWAPMNTKSFDVDAYNQFLSDFEEKHEFHPKAVKRNCFLSAGLSHGCDLASMLHNKFNKFQSFAGPGR